MMQTMAMLGAFLVEHADLIEAIGEAIAGGATKAELMRLIRSSMVAASDLQMKAELKADE